MNYLLKSLTSNSGGFFYHYNSIKFKNKLWTNYIITLNKWLMEKVEDKEKKVCLIGVSAGHSLTSDFISRFSDITIIEPDPLARLIFKYKFLKSTLNFDFKNYFSYHKKDNYFIFNELFTDQSQQNNYILFCNLLGQIPYLKTNATSSDFLYENIPPLLSQHSWISYHDLISFKLHKKFTNFKSLNEVNLKKGIWDVQQLIESITNAPKRKLNVIEHATNKLFDGLRQKKSFLIPWERTPNHWHIIECIKHTHPPQ